MPRQKLPRNICLACGTQCKRHKQIYCSNQCQKDHQYQQYIKRWQEGLEDGMKGNQGISEHLRRYLHNLHDSACQECGWNKIHPITGLVPLTIDHIDGDYRNNKEENLRLLCPNCHSLTPTYGKLNAGNGRENRYAGVAQR